MRDFLANENIRFGEYEGNEFVFRKTDCAQLIIYYDDTENKTYDAYSGPKLFFPISEFSSIMDTYFENRKQQNLSICKVDIPTFT